RRILEAAPPPFSRCKQAHRGCLFGRNYSTSDPDRSPKFTFASLTHPANLRKADKRLLRFKMLFGLRRLYYSCTEALSSEGPRSRHRSEYQSGTAPPSRALDFILQAWVLSGRRGQEYRGAATHRLARADGM